MNKSLILLFVIIVFGNCHEGKQKSNVISDEKFVIPEVILSKDITNELHKWITYIMTDPNYSLSGDELCYTIEFYLDSNTVAKQDTLIWMSYYISTQDSSSFKGVANMGNYHVAILDKNDVGHKYYDSRLLKSISMNSFKSGPTFINNATLVARYKLKNGKLERLIKW